MSPHIMGHCVCGGLIVGDWRALWPTPQHTGPETHEFVLTCLACARKGLITQGMIDAMPLIELPLPRLPEFGTEPPSVSSGVAPSSPPRHLIRR